MHDRWSPAEAPADALDALVYQTRLLGAESALVLHGGGNTSLKRTETDFRGRAIAVMRIKGSGSDLGTVTRRDFPGIRLDDVLPLFERDDLTDAEMVAYLAHCLVEPGSPRPSIETLLHAFIPFASVAHTHADAVLALGNNDRRDELLRAVYGATVLVVPYRRSGFRLSQEVGRAVRAQPQAQGLVLVNHGLVTWGDTLEESYRRHLAIVTAAEEEIARARSGRRTFIAAPRNQTTDAERREIAVRLALLIRGVASRERRVIARFTDAPELLDFVGSPAARAASLRGVATPSHVFATKHQPLWLDLDDARDATTWADWVATAWDRYRAEHDAYVNRWRTDEPVSSPDPRVVLVPGVGMWTLGDSPAAERVARETMLHAIAIMGDAEAVGSYQGLAECDAFDIEYWPAAVYAPKTAGPARELLGRVALVTGAASGIGRAVAEVLAAAGAVVALTDIDADGASRVAAAIIEMHGVDAALAIPCDVTHEEQVADAFVQTIRLYGGLDILVSNAGIAHVAPLDELELRDWQRVLAVNATGHFLATRAALRLFKQQGNGGSIVYVASQNAVTPGREFAAYSAAKAAVAQLARSVALEGGPFGVRANVVNPGAVFGDSRLWTRNVLEGRARAYGVPIEGLEDFYRQRNLLQVRVTAEDVAQAVLFLASDRAAKTTGAMLSVDGGLREAFVR